MKKIKAFYLALILVTGNAFAIAPDILPEDIEYLPELRSAAWSPNLTKADIRRMRLAIYRVSRGNATYGRKHLASYIKDKRNVEARYIYALTLAWVDIDGAIKMLKELSIEGYPYALKTYREERVCKLEQYREVCEKYGFKEVMKRAFLAWARKDPLVPYMYSQARYNLPRAGFLEGTTWINSNEATAILQEGSRAKDYPSIRSLFFTVLKQYKYGDKSKYRDLKHYKALAKNALFTGNYWGSSDTSMSICNKKKLPATYLGLICLERDEYQELLLTFARKGNIKGLSALFYLLGEDFNRNTSFYDYVLFGDESILSEVQKAIYDEAIRVNNGRGWAHHGYSDSIESWEKFFENDETKDFFEGVADLLESE